MKSKEHRVDNSLLTDDDIFEEIMSQHDIKSNV